MQTIELDLSRPWDADDPLGLGEQRPTHGWRNPPPWLVPTLLVVVIVALLGGASAPLPRDPVLEQRTSNASLTFGRDDTVFLYQQRSRSGRLQAYRPGRAGALWTADYPNANPIPVVTPDPGIVGVSVYPANPTQTSTNRIEVRESHSGRKLWQRTEVGIVDASGDLLIVTDYGGWGGGEEQNRPGTLDAVDIRTGTTRWSHPVDHTMLLAVERALPTGPHGDTRAGAHGLAELDRDGVLRILDPISGAARHTVRLPLSGPALYFTVENGMAVVNEARPGDDPTGTDGGPASVVGYDLSTGAVRWHTEAPDFGQPCGVRYMCQYGPEAVIVTDPKTGDVRYRGPSDRISFHGDLMMVSRSATITGDASSGSELWDLSTGRKLRSFGPWQMVANDPRDGNLVAMTGVGGVLLVAVLDLETGTARVIGRARDWLGDASCTFGRRYVGCTGPGGVRIWRVPDGIGPVE